MTAVSSEAPRLWPLRPAGPAPQGSRAVLHVATSRSALARLTPLAGALRARGIEQAGVGARPVDGDAPPATLAALERPLDDAAAMLGVEAAVGEWPAGLVVIAGDGDADVSAALAAVGAGAPVVRLGAGLRSGDWTEGREV